MIMLLNALKLTDFLKYAPHAPATTDAPTTAAEALVTARATEESVKKYDEEISDGALAGKDLVPSYDSILSNPKHTVRCALHSISSKCFL